MRRQERKRGAMVIPPQAGLTVKALSPDKTVMGAADGVYGPAGNSPLEGGGWGKWEAPIRATRSGNADGAKGCRFEGTGKGDMARHRAGEVMTTGLTRLTQRSHSGEDSNWAPDGVTNPVRFCEGAGGTVGWWRSEGTAGKPG